MRVQPPALGPSAPWQPPARLLRPHSPLTGGAERPCPAGPRATPAPSRSPHNPRPPSLPTGGQESGSRRRSRGLADWDEGHGEVELGGRGREQQVGAAGPPGLRRRHGCAPATSLPHGGPALSARTALPSSKMAAVATRPGGLSAYG